MTDKPIEAMEREWAKFAEARKAMREGPLVIIGISDAALAWWRDKQKKPAKIRAGRTIKAMGVASLLRYAPMDGSVGGIDKASSPYWQNVGSEQ